MHTSSTLIAFAALYFADPATPLHFNHRWFLPIFLVCGAIVLSNVVHYVLFRLIRRKEVQASTLGWGLQRHLGRPARAVFILACLLAVLPSVPHLPYNLDTGLHQGFIMALVVAMGWFGVGLVYMWPSRSP